MKVIDLLVRITEMCKKDPDILGYEIDLLTETKEHGQIEQVMDDIAKSRSTNRIKFLPKDFI